MRNHYLLGIVPLALTVGFFSTNAASNPPLSGQAAVLSQHRLQQLALTCTDLDRAVTFYRDKLGLPLLFIANNMAFFDLGGMRLMVAADGQRPAVGRPTSVVYFDAPDFEASLARLRASDAKLVGGVETVQRSTDGDLKLQQFEDPDGNMLAIMGTVRTNGSH